MVSVDPSGVAPLYTSGLWLWSLLPQASFAAGFYPTHNNDQLGCLLSPWSLFLHLPWQNGSKFWMGGVRKPLNVGFFYNGGDHVNIRH